jgi:hypothetical protein
MSNCGIFHKREIDHIFTIANHVRDIAISRFGQQASHKVLVAGTEQGVWT